MNLLPLNLQESNYNIKKSMDFTKIHQALHRKRTALLVVDKRNGRKKTPQKTYSKAINPLNLQTKIMSLKNLDLLQTQSSISSNEDSFENNKSCCCSDCGKLNKKVKNIQKKFTTFKTKMSILNRSRLKVKFQNAVYCLIFLIQRKKKLKQLEKQKKMFRFKTKIFNDGSPISIQTQQPQLQSQKSNFFQTQNNEEKQPQSHQHFQSVQAKIIEQRHKQRQSVKTYLEHKLNERGIILQNTETQISLPKLYQGKFSFNSQSLVNIVSTHRIKLHTEDQSSPRTSQLKQNNQQDHQFVNQSPYLNQLAIKNQIDTILNSCSKTPRPQLKSSSQDNLLQKSQFRQHQRKNTAFILKQ